MSKYLIIGSGISGCTAADELAKQGNDVELIESNNVIGGSILGYTCKATDECSRCGVCVAYTRLHDALRHQNVNASVGTSIQSVSNNGSIDIVISSKNPSINYSTCISCDKCVHACPEHCITKIHRGELLQYALEYEKCLLHQGQQCSVCSDICPTNAISSQTAITETTISGDAALVATGHDPYDAKKKIRFGYGRVENVITGVEAEEILNRQTYLRNPSDSIAFIQCVGSRDPSINRNYCSSVCCAYALRLARVIKYRNPETPVTIYYIDIQNFDKTFTLFRKSVEESGVQFVRGLPFIVDQSNNGKLKLRIEDMEGEETIVEHDTVVLSVGMGATNDADNIASLFGLQQDEFGFFFSSTSRLFVSGTCKEPLSITDSMTAARATALEMLRATDGKQAPALTTKGSIQEKSGDEGEPPALETKTIPLQQTALVIGSGIAGNSVAQELLRFGYSTTLIEQSSETGGQHPPEVLSIDNQQSTIENPEGVELLTGSSLIELTGSIGNFSARLHTSEGEKLVECGAVVIASGDAASSDRDEPRINTGLHSSHIVSMFDMNLAIADLMKRKGIRTIGLVLDLACDEGKASMEMAFNVAKSIQALKRYQVCLFCRDIRVAAKELELLYDESREAGINIVNYVGKLSFDETEKGVTITYTDAIIRREMTVYCDRVGVSPFGVSIKTDPQLAELAQLSTDSYGHIQDNNIHLFPEQTNRPGIFTVGSCRGQHYVPQIIADAKATALEVHALLSQRELEVELSNAVVDPDKCILCLTCIRSCPHKAMLVNREQGAAESIPEACQKCGICAGECPAKAIELPIYSDKILLSQVV